MIVTCCGSDACGPGPDLDSAVFRRSLSAFYVLRHLAADFYSAIFVCVLSTLNVSGRGDDACAFSPCLDRVTVTVTSSAASLSSHLLHGTFFSAALDSGSSPASSPHLPPSKTPSSHRQHPPSSPPSSPSPSASFNTVPTSLPNPNGS